MHRRKFFALAFLILSLLALLGWQGTDGKLDDAGLKTMLTNLGYEVKEPGTGTYEIPMAAAGLNIPTRIFIAKSQTKIWLSVALLQKDGVDKLTRDDLQKILEENVNIGPCHFMIEGGWLKLKMAIDNRGVTPAILRSELGYIADRVGDSKAVWQK